MGTKSRETIYGASIRASTERARAVRKEADRLACVDWNQRMLGYKGPAQPSPALSDALNAGFRYLEVRCLGCDTHQTVALDIVRRPKSTPIHELERYMRCKDCSQVRGYHTSAATWWRCGRPRFRPAIPRRRGGRGSDSPCTVLAAGVRNPESITRCFRSGRWAMH
jgi:ribosomal protein S27E